MSKFLVVRNTVFCGVKRSPGSVITCEERLVEEWFDEDIRQWVTRTVDHWINAEGTALMHAGRGKRGQWFFWTSPLEEDSEVDEPPDNKKEDDHGR